MISTNIKRELYGLFMVSMLIMLSVNVAIAENITVYVKNQDGDNVGKETYLEVRYKGDMVSTAKIGSEAENKIFDVNHTGTYDLWALTQFEFRKKDCVSPDCGSECWNYTSNPGYVYQDRNDVPYKCNFLYMNCSGDGCVPFYEKVYTFLSIGYTRTHVKEGEDDVARITLETRSSKLWKHSNTTGYVVNTSTGIGDTLIWRGGEETAEEAIEQLLQPEIIKSELKANLAAILVVNFVSKAVNPEEDLEDFWNDLLTPEGVGEIVADVGVSRGVKLITPRLLPQIGIPLLLVEVPMSIWEEKKRCDYTETDDLEVIVNAEPGYYPDINCSDPPSPYGICKRDGVPAEFSCHNPEEVFMFNRGNRLYDASLEVSDAWKQCKKILTEPADFSRSFDLDGPTESVNFFATLMSTDYGDFRDYARLAYNTVTVPGANLCRKGTRLSNFMTTVPVIGDVNYDKVGYPGDSITVSSEIYDDQGILGGGYTLINWTHNGIARSATMTPGGYPLWRGDITIPANATDGDTIYFKIRAMDTEYHETVNDNDQRMFRIRVIEDSDYGGDVPDVKADAYRVSPSALDRTGWLWPQPGEVFGSEQDWYKVYVEKGKNYRIDVNTDGLLGLGVEKPNAPSEYFLISNQGGISFNHSSSGFLYLGFVPFNIADYGMNYSFRVGETGQPWFDPYTNTVAYSTPFRRYFSFVCGGTETYSCLGEMQASGVYDVSAYFKDVDGYDPNNLVPGTGLSFDAYTAKNCSNDNKEYIDVRVGVMPNTGQGGITVISIQPVIKIGDGNWKDLDCDAKNINTFVPDGTTRDLTAKVPVINSDETYYVKMRVNYNFTTNQFYYVHTEPFAYKLNVTKAPTLNNFTATVSYNSVKLEAYVSDDEKLSTAKFYFDSALKCTQSLGGKNGIASCTVNTSGLSDDTNHNTHVEVYDKESSYFRSDRVYPTIRNDLEKPLILSSYVLPTDKGEVYYNNVSGTVMLGASTYDTESGLQGISWYKNGVYLGSGATLNWSTGTADGNYDIRVNVTDFIGNYDSKTFTVNVDNTPPVILGKTPGNGDVLEGIVRLEVNATDSGSALKETEWFLGEMKIGSGTKTIWGSSGLDGNYVLTVNVSDVVGNVRSENISVTIRSPDLYINESEVEVTDNNITAVIRNLGSLDAVDVNISFYSGNESFTSELINVSAKGSEIIVVDYTPTEEDLIIVADPYDWITEISEWNNYVVVRRGGNESLPCFGINPPLFGDWNITESTQCVDARIFLSLEDILRFFNKQVLTLQNTEVHMETGEIDFGDGGTLVLDNATIWLD